MGYNRHIINLMLLLRLLLLLLLLLLVLALDRLAAAVTSQGALMMSPALLLLTPATTAESLVANVLVILLRSTVATSLCKRCSRAKGVALVAKLVVAATEAMIMPWTEGVCFVWSVFSMQ